MKFTEFVQAFLFHCSVERRLSEHTVNAYRGDLLDLQRFLTRDVNLADLNVERLRCYLTDLTLRRGLSAATARRRIACLRAFWKFAAADNGVVNPFGDWSPAIKKPRRLPKALHAPEISCLVKATWAHQQNDALPTDVVQCTRLAVWIILVTGVRVSELCAIQIHDISPDGDAIRISGKGNRDRQVYVADPALKNAISDERNRRLQSPTTETKLLLNSRGRPLTPQTLRQRLHRLTLLADLDRKVTPHMLRHTAATKLIEKGVDIRFVQRLLGHASIATTEIYTHVTDASLKRALGQANAWAGLMNADA